MKLTLCLLVLTASPLLSQELTLKLEKRDGNIVSIPLSAIGKITIDRITSIDSNITRLDRLFRSFKLVQNYPNPFNPQTTIEYELPTSGKVSISIFDISGREVRTLHDSHQENGTHTITWNSENNDGHKVATGAYICRVIFENQILVTKMLITK